MTATENDTIDENEPEPKEMLVNPKVRGKAKQKNRQPADRGSESLSHGRTSSIRPTRTSSSELYLKERNPRRKLRKTPK